MIPSMLRVITQSLTSSKICSGYCNVVTACSNMFILESRIQRRATEHAEIQHFKLSPPRLRGEYSPSFEFEPFNTLCLACWRQPLLTTRYPKHAIEQP